MCTPSDPNRRGVSHGEERPGVGGARRRQRRARHRRQARRGPHGARGAAVRGPHPDRGRARASARRCWPRRSAGASAAASGASSSPRTCSRPTSPASRSSTRRPRSSSSGPARSWRRWCWPTRSTAPRRRPRARCWSAWRSGRRPSTASPTRCRRPFLVIATQNPIEYEGTFALPEAQLDRFMLRLRLGYPEGDGGDRHPRRAEAPAPHRRTCSRSSTSRSCARCRRRIKEIYVDQAVAEYIVRLVRRHPRAPRRLPGRLAARLAEPVPLGPGARRARRARLRHPRRREAAGGRRPRPIG